MSNTDSIQEAAKALLTKTNKTAFLDALSVIAKGPDAEAIALAAIAMEEGTDHSPDAVRILKSFLAKQAKNKPKTKATLAVVEVTTDAPAATQEDPQWVAIRETAARVREAGRSFLEMQAWLGWMLSQAKKDHGIRKGRPNKSADSADLPKWGELVRTYTGYSERTGDVLINLYESTKAKLKKSKLPEQKQALTLFTQGNPLALPPEQREYVRNVIADLCDGETQGSLMAELGVIPKPPKPIKSANKGSAAAQPDEELAFHHWDGAAKAIVTARTQEGLKLLHLLPPTTDEPGKLSLVFIRDEAAALAAAAEEALAAAMKPKATPAA